MSALPFGRFYNQRLLNLAVYSTLIILAGIGLVILPGVPAKVAASILCFAFGLAHANRFQGASTGRQAALYFTIQMAVMGGLIWLAQPSDIFNFLFFVLGIQATLILPARPAAVWIVLFYIVDSASALWSRGVEGFVGVFFYGAAFILVGIFGSILRQSELARRENERLLEELQATQRQLQALAVTEERNRLARDLHDSAKQQAFALSAQLDAVHSLIERDSQAAQTHLAQAIRLADNLRQELASLILELRPSAIGEEGLAAALRRYAAEWSQQSGIAVTVQVQGERPFSTEIQNTLFRIAQEALANVARHSGAGRVELNLEYAADSVQLTLQDDGQGFDPLQVTPGVGTHSMRERAAALPKGTLTLSSAPGQGTCLIVQCSA